MSHKDKTKQELLDELNTAQQRISELEAAQEAMRADASTVNAILEVLPNLMFRLSANGTHLEFYAPHQSQLFVQPGDFLGKTVDEVLPCEVATKYTASIQRSLEQGQKQIFEYSLEFKDRGRVDYEAHMVVAGEDEVIVLVHDITKRKRAEDALRQSEARNRALLNASTDTALLVMLDGTIIAVNEAGAASLGKSRNEIVDTNVFDLLPPDVAELRKAQGNLVAQTGTPVRFEDTRAGLYFDNTVFPISDAEGNVTQLAIFSRDITERKRAEQTLQARLRLSEYAINNSIGDLFQRLLSEAETLSESQISFLHVVDADQQTLSFQAAASQGLNLSAANEQAHPILINEAGVWQDCIVQRQSIVHNDDTSKEHPEGLFDRPFIVNRILLAPVIRDNLVVAIVAVANKPDNYDKHDVSVVSQLANLGWDIIARKQAEIELSKRDQVLALKDRIISTVSHEFRTPLAIIQTSYELLTRYGDRLDEQHKHRAFEEIHQQIVTLTRILDSILSINRVQAGKTDFNPTMLNIEVFCKIIFDQIRFMDNAKRQFDFVSNLSAKTVNADGNLLQHILSNLLSNAVKYSPERSRISLELDQNVDNIFIKVRDEGIGIPEADQSHLFEPFHRASNVGNTAGTGMGLAIAKEYIDLHGGSIEVQSEVKKGSTFIVALPVA